MDCLLSRCWVPYCCDRHIAYQSLFDESRRISDFDFPYRSAADGSSDQPWLQRKHQTRHTCGRIAASDSILCRSPHSLIMHLDPNSPKDRQATWPSENSCSRAVSIEHCYFGESRWPQVLGSRSYTVEKQDFMSRAPG